MTPGTNSTGGRVASIPAVANRSLVQSIYLHRSCLPLVEVDLGSRDVTGGVAHSECEGMCGP